MFGRVIEGMDVRRAKLQRTDGAPSASPDKIDQGDRALQPPAQVRSPVKLARTR